MEFIQNHWGGLASVLGLLISAIGLGWAVREARKARRAAESAQQAADRGARETADTIRSLSGVSDLRKAIALIQRLKLLHSEGRWEAALEQYQALREIISEILSKYRDWDEPTRSKLLEYRLLITPMERQVETYMSGNADDRAIDWDRMNAHLNEIQEVLEERVGEVSFGRK